MATDLRQIILIHSECARRAQLSSMLSTQFGWCSVGSTIDTLATRFGAADVVVVETDNTWSDYLESRIECIRAVQPRAAIIIMTPDANPSIMRRAFLSGVHDCVMGTTSDRELIASVRRVVRQAAPSPHRPKPPSGFPATPPMDHSEFLHALSKMRDTCRRRGQSVTLTITDLDRFRECNDRFTSTFADGVLRWFAKNLHAAAPIDAIVACLGSDRFAIATPNERADRAARRAQRLHRTLRDNPIRFEGSPFEITASVGIAESTSGFVESEQQLLRRASIATDQAKQQGGNRTVTWSGMFAEQPARDATQHLPTMNVDHWMTRAREQLRSTYVESTRALVAAVEARDPHTQTHSATVSTYAETIARRMGIGSAMIDTLRAASLLHDIGKIGIPDAILTKPGPLTENEFAIVKQHPRIAVDILQHASYLNNERPLILHHHERFDGKGYPDNLKGDYIPIGARILAVADSLDVMFSSRSYKPPFPLERVRAELQAESGKQFDPAVAATALQWLDAAPDACESRPLGDSVAPCH